MLKRFKEQKVIRVLQMAGVVVFCAVVLLGCGAVDDGGNTIVGSVQVSWLTTDCPEGESLSIVALAYDHTNAYIDYGGPWACASGIGLISGITVGPERKIALFAEDGGGKFKYRGEKRNIVVQENTIAYADDIKLYNFVASPLLPEDGASLAGEYHLSWNYVTGAAKYRVTLSDNANFLNPIITETVVGPPYTPPRLTTGVRYYWSVTCLDIFDNESAGSDVRNFLFREPDVNIKSPLDGQEFSWSDDIQFSGAGQDLNGRPLTGRALVWKSSIDGILTSGATFSLFDLDGEVISEGTHIITLTGTDDEGYSGSDSITLHIVAVE